MNPKLLFLFLTGFLPVLAFSQTYRVHGKITNTKLEPLALVSVEVKDYKLGTTTREDGTYEISLEEGKYDLLVTMIGYKPQVITIVVKGRDYQQNLIMEEEAASELSTVYIRGRQRDRSEEIIRNVIRNKDRILAAAGDHSCEVYIKATQEDSASRKMKMKNPKDSLRRVNPNADLVRMAMAEVVLQLDRKATGQIKEERTGITKRGNVESLFFLTNTDGDFNFYNNLIKAPALSEVPFLSPVSYSGLVAYKFKLLKTEQKGSRKIYTISVKPTQLSNATVEGEITIMDSAWVILHTRFRFPPYHLPEYDFFEVEQNYSLVKDKAWMLTRQEFTYFSKTNRAKKSGETVVAYRQFELNKEFSRNYFGLEVSSTAQEAYEKDSSFWIVARSEPLTPKEVRFIHYKDSVYRAIHSEAYLDSLDKVINRVTVRKLLLTGQNFHSHEKERTWYFPPLPNLYQPFQFGGGRIQASAFYSKVFKSRKSLTIWTDLSYGLRNHDLNGSIRFTRMYNPFNRGYYTIELGRRFEYIFEGDAWVNMLKRNNVYLNNSISVDHGLELVNGLHLYTTASAAIRRSVSGYKINPKVDSLFGEYLPDNHPVAFEGYNAIYGEVKLAYTPRQRYIREPKEKIIIGSSWPTFYVSLRKGLPGIFNSKVNFDYLEFGLEQQIKLGLLGTSTYTVKSGSFISSKDLRLVDYQWQRRGDPFFFMNPNRAFQALDSTFAVFRRFYQGHYVHEFNGAIFNKIPLFKKIQLREVAGAGFLIAQERNLHYVEAFAGLERVFKWPFDAMTKFKLGVYVVGSAANQFRNPVQFKIGVTSWDKRKNRWF